MASTHKSLRSGTANKRPTTSIADGQIALNTNVTSPGLYFKDSTGASIIKIGPVHVGTTAPNVAPAGSSGNSTGEAWLDTSLTPNGWKVWTGAAWLNATPVGSDTVQGLLELATNAETQAGSDTARAVTPAGLQSKVSDSTSTTSSTTIASSTAVKAAYDLANAALPKSGGTVTGNLEIGNTGSLTFEGSTADAFETTLAVVDPTADRTISLPNVTGTVVTTGDTGSVTSTMILDGTILNADINASAAIVDTKLATISTAGKVSNSATTATNANTPSTIVARDGSGNFTAGTITAALVGNASTVTTNANLTGDVTSVGNATSIATGVIVNADINASAAIAGTKISPDFGSQNTVTTGNVIGNKLLATSLGTAAFPAWTFTGDLNTGLWSPGADQLAISNNASETLRIDSSRRVLIGNGTVGSVGQGEPLQIVRSNTADLLGLYTYGATEAAELNFGRSLNSVIGSGTTVNEGSSLGRINFRGWTGASFQEFASIAALVDGTAGSNDTPGRLSFSTSPDGVSAPTEAMRISSQQEVLIGYTSDNGAYKLQVNSQIFATSSTVATSDGRYKENVVTLGGCLDLVKALRPVSFTWKPQEDITRTDEDGNDVLVREGHNFPDGTQVGFIAQEVQEVLAEKPWLTSVIKQNRRSAVTDAEGDELAPEEEFFGIAEGNLIAVLTSALQETVERIEQLEAKVNALESN
jgi:hypothetical protein